MFNLQATADTFGRRMIGMMSDYDITMFDALLWDFEGFGDGCDSEVLFETKGLEALEKRFRQYLAKCGLEEGSQDYYVGIFMGFTPNVELHKNAKE